MADAVATNPDSTPLFRRRDISAIEMFPAVWPEGIGSRLLPFVPVVTRGKNRPH